MQMRIHLARLTSNILSPYLVSLVMLILLSFKSTSTTLDAIKWSLISIALSILPVFAVVVYLVYNRQLQGVFISPRGQRNKIYLLATFCGVAGCIVLFCFGAPRLLSATFVAGLLAIVAFMGINLRWKISVHTAFVASAITILIIAYGPVMVATAVLMPLIAWARIKLEQHSPAQVVTGAILSALIVLAVFYFLGLVGTVSHV